MKRDRHKLLTRVKELYPYHTLADGIEFAMRRGQLMYSDWLYLTNQDDPDSEIDDERQQILAVSRG